MREPVVRVIDQAIQKLVCTKPENTKFQLLMKTKMLKMKVFCCFCFQALSCCIFYADKCYNANNCWHFNIYEHD